MMTLTLRCIVSSVLTPYGRCCGCCFTLLAMLSKFMDIFILLGHILVAHDRVKYHARHILWL